MRRDDGGANMLREYQRDVVENVRHAMASGSKAAVLVMPCGSGKTAVAGELVRSATAKGKRVLFLAPRRELISQASQRLSHAGIMHGLIMAGERASFMPDVQVASIPTLHKRCISDARMPLPDAELVIVDEAHIGVGGRAQRILDSYLERGSRIVGLTATPARTDGKALGLVYDELVMGPTVAELTGWGYLVPARYFAGERPDLSGVKITAGDYQQDQLEAATDQDVLVGNVVANWQRIAADRPTFVFSTSVAHSRHLCDRFRAAGYAAEHIDGQTDSDERDAIQQRLRDGVTQVVCNCQVMTYGVDFPPVSAIVLARPTKSLPMYLQMVGRGLRPSPDTGKSDCLVIDHAGAVDELGFVDDEIPWTLEGRQTINERKERQRQEKGEPKSITCPSCSTVFQAQQCCPSCGLQMQSQYRQAVEEVDAELREIRRKEAERENRQWSVDEKADFYGQLRHFAKQKGYKSGWADHKYREKLGVWPNDPRIKGAPLQEPSRETANWIKSRQIAAAKRKEAA